MDSACQRDLRVVASSARTVSYLMKEDVSGELGRLVEACADARRSSTVDGALELRALDAPLRCAGMLAPSPVLFEL